MRKTDFIKMGLKNLARRKLRTSLTVMGVVIGTFSIVVMVSLGIAMTEGYKEQISQMGDLTTITVNRYYYNADTGISDTKELDDNLIMDISKILHVQCVTPVQYLSVNLISGKYESWSQLCGIDPNAFKYFEFPEIEEGRYLEPDDTDGMLISAHSTYFYNPNSNSYRNNEDAVDMMNDRVKFTINANYGEDVMPKYYTFKPVGKMVESNGDKNGYLYVNITQLQKWKKELKKSGATTYDDDGYSAVWVSVEDMKYVEEVQEQIKAMGYGTYSLADMVGEMQKTSNTLQLILGGIGAISLLVSAIGIANTMVMSIYERTKEIGVMKVLGCLISDIRKLFLFEASMIGFFGGAIGVGLSYFVSFIMNKYSGQIGSALGIGMAGSKISVIPVWLAVLAMGFAMLVGIMSGYFPAKRATKIKALEAIRESN